MSGAEVVYTPYIARGFYWSARRFRLTIYIAESWRKVDFAKLLNLAPAYSSYLVEEGD